MRQSHLVKKLAALSAGAVLLVLLAASPVLSGALYSQAAATSLKSEKPPVPTWKNAPSTMTALTSLSICPSQSFLAAPSVAGQIQVMNVNWKVKNDEDSGISGYWGMDHFSTTLKVWLFPNGTWYALKTYNGAFTTPQGGISPGPVAGTQNETGYGTFTGGYVATFDGAFNPGPKHTGFLGFKDYGGTLTDIQLQTYGNGQVGDKHAYDWLGTYFSGNTYFNQPHWGWDYKLANQFQYPGGSYEWCNFNAGDGGNSGDIFVPNYP